MSVFFIAPQSSGKTTVKLLDNIHFILFGVVFLITAILAFIKKYSLIPVLGFLCCTYLLCESGTSNWLRFMIWLAVGLVIYFLYGAKHSLLGIKEEQANTQNITDK